MHIKLSFTDEVMTNIFTNFLKFYDKITMLHIVNSE
jgi:hypothetical protein